ncbi:MAG: DMT family transporter [Comamonadaceae bacterium]|nr:MAG: DMT family transporter [Comamonadaceae bacterium]
MPASSPAKPLFAPLSEWFNSRAWLLLVFTTLIWGANAVAARLAVGEASPMFVTTARWVVCCCALGMTARREIALHWRALLPHWRFVTLMGTLGFTGFNALFYTAAHHTTAINIAILQGTIPVLVLAGSAWVYRTRITTLQVIGVTITLGGIVVIAAQGQLARVAQFAFNIGDVWMVVASLLYTFYALGLRRRPAVPAIVFFAATALVASLVSLPLLAAEVATGHFIVPTTRGLMLILFIGLLPSYVSQLTFMRAVTLIGPARAGVYLNLVPVFGPLLAVLVLGEPLATYHAVALALVLGGIWIAESLGARKP